MHRTYRQSDRERNGLLDLIDTLPGGPLAMVEIGCAAGESAELFAESAKFSRVVCVDPWRHAKFEDKEPRFDAVAARWPCIEKVKSASVEAAAAHVGTLDFAYIDAVHTYDGVISDINAWLPHIRPGGWIGGHDYEWHFPGVIQAVSERFYKPYRVFQDASWLVRLS